MKMRHGSSNSRIQVGLTSGFLQGGYNRIIMIPRFIYIDSPFTFGYWTLYQLWMHRFDVSSVDHVTFAATTMYCHHTTYPTD